MSSDSVEDAVDRCLPVFDASQDDENSSSLVSPLVSCRFRSGLLIALSATALLLLTAQIVNPWSSSTRTGGGGGGVDSSASLIFASPGVAAALLSSLTPNVQSIAAFPRHRASSPVNAGRQQTRRSDHEAGEAAEAAEKTEDEDDEDEDAALDAEDEEDEETGRDAEAAADSDTGDEAEAKAKGPQQQQPQQQQRSRATKCDATAGLLYVLPFLPVLPLASVQPCVAFASISSALTEARKVRAAKPDSAVSVLLYPTLHFQSETLLLTQEDSGRPGAPLIIAAMPDDSARFFRRLKDEWKASQQQQTAGKGGDAAALSAWRPDSPQPIISGGAPLREWTASGDAGVWSHAAPSPRLPVSQLFCGGLRANRSRLPAVGFYSYKFARQGQKTGMTVDPAELRISNLEDAEWVVYHSWTTSRHLYRSHNAQSGELETANPTMWDFGFKQGAASRYHVENAKEGLQAAGDFYFSEKERRVYYRPHAGIDPNTQADCIAPVLETVVEVKGEQDSGKRAAFIEMRDVAVQHSAWSMQRGPSFDYQATSWIQLSAVHTLYAHDVEYRRLLISHSGGYGWWCEKGCTDVRLLDSEVTDTASGGVRVGLDREMREANVPQPHDVLKAVVVQNNEIHHIGHVFADGVGALLHRTEDTLLKGNHIHHTYYSGVSVGWEWGYSKSGTRNNTIEANYIHHIGQRMLTDQAGIYTLGTADGSHILHNVIHDVYAWAGLEWGIYLDEGSVGWTVRDNVVYNTGWESFFLHYGRENIVDNNVFARAEKGKLDGRDETRAAWAVDWSEKHLSLTFTHNVVYDLHTPQTANGDFRLMFGAQRDVRVVCDNNLYWQVNGMDMRFGDARLTWKQWQERGQDKHGVVADPRFLHPTLCDFFHLDPNSPAIAMGFKPIEPIAHWIPGCKETATAGSVPAAAAAAAPAAPAPAPAPAAGKETKPQLPPPTPPAAPTPVVSTPPAVTVSPVSASVPAAALTLYVVPFAADLHAASNIAPAPPDGSLQLPFPSLAAALGHLSGLASAEYPVHVALYPCYHLLNATLRLSEQQSGQSASKPLVIRTMDAGDAKTVRKKKELLLIKDGAGSLRYRADMLETGQAVISGGLQLQGWKRDSGRKAVWSVELPTTSQVTQLFVDGRRVNRTRLPAAGVWSWKEAGAASRNSFTADVGQLESIASVQGVDVVMYNGFTSSRHRLLSFDSGSRRVKLSHPAHWQLGSFHADRRFHIENVQEALTQPNSFWWDAQAGRLWYHAADDEADVNTLLTIVPQLDTVLELAGQQDSSKRLQWLQLADIAVAHSSWQLPDGGETEYPLAAWLSIATVHIAYAQHVSFSNLRISNSGAFAWWCERGCHDVSLSQSAITDTAAGAVRLGTGSVGTGAAVPAAADEVTAVSIVGNSLSYGGQVFIDTAAVLAQRVRDCVVSGNDVHHHPNTGVALGWEWTAAASGSSNNSLCYNAIHSIGAGGQYLSELAAVLTTGASASSSIHHNVIHAVSDYGIWLHDASALLSVHHNVVYRTGNAALYQNAARDNTVTNNVLIGPVAVDQADTRSTSLSMHRNVIILDGTTMNNTKYPQWIFQQMTAATVNFSHNLYFSYQAKAETLLFGIQRLSWSEWRTTGQDEGSVVADPLFVAADKCNYFEVKQDSPLKALGWETIDRLPSWTAGCQEDEAEQAHAVANKR